MKAVATEREGIWSMSGTHVVMGRGWGAAAVSYSDIHTWTAWKRVITERQGEIRFWLMFLQALL